MIFFVVMSLVRAEENESGGPPLAFFGVLRWRGPEGGVGLVTIGGCTINETSGSGKMLSVRGDRFIRGLAGLAKAVQGHGAKISPQLSHRGNRGAGSEATGSGGILEKQEKAVRARSGLCLGLFPF